LILVYSPKFQILLRKAKKEIQESGGIAFITEHENDRPEAMALSRDVCRRMARTHRHDLQGGELVRSWSDCSRSNFRERRQDDSTQSGTPDQNAAGDGKPQRRDDRALRKTEICAYHQAGLTMGISGSRIYWRSAACPG